jgi:hypothetical protein
MFIYQQAQGGMQVEASSAKKKEIENIADNSNFKEGTWHLVYVNTNRLNEKFDYTDCVQQVKPDAWRKGANPTEYVPVLAKIEKVDAKGGYIELAVVGNDGNTVPVFVRGRDDYIKNKTWELKADKTNIAIKFNNSDLISGVFGGIVKPTKPSDFGARNPIRVVVDEKPVPVDEIFDMSVKSVRKL